MDNMFSPACFISSCDWVAGCRGRRDGPPLPLLIHHRPCSRTHSSQDTLVHRTRKDTDCVPPKPSHCFVVDKHHSELRIFCRGYSTTPRPGADFAFQDEGWCSWPVAQFRHANTLQLCSSAMETRSPSWVSVGNVLLMDTTQAKWIFFRSSMGIQVHTRWKGRKPITQ